MSTSFFSPSSDHGTRQRRFRSQSSSRIPHLSACALQRSLHLAIPLCGKTAPVSISDSMSDRFRRLHIFQLRGLFQLASAPSTRFSLFSVSFRHRKTSLHHTVCKNVATAAPCPSVLSSGSRNRQKAFAHCVLSSTASHKSAPLSNLQQTALVFSQPCIPYSTHIHSPLHSPTLPQFRSPPIFFILLRRSWTQSAALISHTTTVSEHCDCQSSLSP